MTTRAGSAGGGRAVFSLAALEHPIVLAPMGGGPSTIALAAAVSQAGGLGFLAAGYKTVDGLRDDLTAIRAATTGGRPIGVNVFVPSGTPADPAVVSAYASRLRDAGLETGEPRWDDDAFDGKLAVLMEERPAVASFTFGLPPQDAVEALHDRAVAVWVTVTTPAEALAAARAGADAVVCQGVEAGGHRGGFDDRAPGDYGVLALLQLAGAAVDVPLVATGAAIPEGRVVRRASRRNSRCSATSRLRGHARRPAAEQHDARAGSPHLAGFRAISRWARAPMVGQQQPRGDHAQYDDPCTPADGGENGQHPREAPAPTAFRGGTRQRRGRQRHAERRTGPGVRALAARRAGPYEPSISSTTGLLSLRPTRRAGRRV